MDSLRIELSAVAFVNCNISISLSTESDSFSATDVSEYVDDVGILKELRVYQLVTFNAKVVEHDDARYRRSDITSLGKAIIQINDNESSQ